MATADEQGAESVSVLVLDDSEPIVEILAQLLANLGVGKVLTAGDGERGLAVYDAAARPPDLLICDLSMPGMGGIEFLRHVAARGYEGGVILSSGADADALKAAERLAQAHGLDLLGAMAKPVTEAVLAAALRRCGRPRRSSSGSGTGNAPTKGEGTMSEKPLVMTVEDDPSMRDIIATALEGNYRVAGALGGEEALRAARALRPQAILLDVEMPPGIDGYEVCRRLKQDEATAEIPVVFVSARDSVENRLLGYEAGGEDYIVKPFDILELEAKLAHLVKTMAERTGLKEMANYASSTAMTAMTSMSEMGALLQAMKSFGACADGRELAEAALAGLAPYGLTGAVQVRGADGTLTRDARGEASPLEASVITQMAAMERIVQFKSRMAISYRRVSLLVHDMPVEDAERCGRLRDHLAMLVEAADARAEAIAAAEESRRRGATIERAVSRITTALADIDRAQRQNQVATRLAVESVTQQMETAYVSVALSPAQEDYMAGILRQGIDRLLNTQTGVFGLQNQLSSIVHELKGMSASPQ